MYKIYINNNHITFSSSKPEKSDNTKVYHILEPNQELDTTKVLQKVENNKNVVIVCYDCDKVLEQFAQNFEVRDAAGGLVFNEEDKYLMIFRNGKWDLPKGHLEKGETLEQCAEREVQEECGLKSLVLKDKICLTMHIYKLKGRNILKRSHWYGMQGDAQDKLIPQSEEGIEKVKWMTKKKMDKLRDDSYKNICEVIDIFFESN